MLKINLKTTLVNLEGEAIKDKDGDVAYIGKVMANAIMSNSSTKDPVRNYLLCQKLYTEDEIDVTAEELEYIKSQIQEVTVLANQMFPVIYKGQILHVLDQVDKKPKDAEKKD